MSVVLGLTKYSTIRAQLGASNVDLSDDYLDDLSIATDLQLDLLSWFPNYQSLIADASGDEAVIRQQLALQIYAKMFCAYRIATVVPMKFLQKVVDGEDQAIRFQNAKTMSEFKESLKELTYNYKNSVLATTTSHNPPQQEQVSHPGISLSKPNTDVITG